MASRAVKNIIDCLGDRPVDLYSTIDAAAFRDHLFEKGLVSSSVRRVFSIIRAIINLTILEFGLGDKFKALFDEVQRSNMSKACSSEEEARATQAHYADRDGTQSTIAQKGDQWMVYRQGDNKVLKSVNYSPADLPKILEQ